MKETKNNFNYTLIDQSVGQQLRARRESAGLSQKELGDYLGITLQQIQKYERGTNRISASKLYAISKLLDVPVQYFFDTVDLENPPVPLKLRGDKEISILFSEIKDKKVRLDIKKLIKALLKSQ